MNGIVYDLYIDYALSGVKKKRVRVESKWDLFGVIGFLHSTSLENINRISYKVVTGESCDGEADWMKNPKKNYSSKGTSL